MMKTILIVMDDTMVGSLIINLITHNTSHFVILVNNSTEAFLVTEEIKPDVFLFEHLLPIINGINLYDCLHNRKELQDIPAIIFSKSTSQPYLQEEIQQRHLVCLYDPFPLSDFLLTLEKMLGPNPLS